jgi:hypothetical protein
MMNMKQALQRIEELERKVAELQAREPTVIHYHYNPAPAQLYQPQPWPLQPWCAIGAGTSN